jgi:LysR family transcriptional regulator, transcriptional activator of the cysJI operon
VLLENFRLKVFRAVAEHLSFRKAGEALYLTQPAVTLQIKALEEELGTKLFERSATGVRVTEAGKVLLQYAEQHQLAGEAEGRLAALKGEIAGDLVLWSFHDHCAVCSARASRRILACPSGNPVTSVQRKYGARG